MKFDSHANRWSPGRVKECGDGVEGCVCGGGGGELCGGGGGGGAREKGGGVRDRGSKFNLNRRDT